MVLDNKIDFPASDLLFKEARSWVLILSLPWNLICMFVVFWRAAWCTGERRGPDRWEVHFKWSSSFWLIFGSRCQAENRCVRITSVCGATWICCWFGDFINKIKLNTCCTHVATYLFSLNTPYKQLQSVHFFF